MYADKNCIQQSALPPSRLSEYTNIMVAFFGFTSIPKVILPNKLLHTLPLSHLTSTRLHVPSLILIYLSLLKVSSPSEACNSPSKRRYWTI
jgi:hypothetical protein